jgi:hypothetical protein
MFLALGDTPIALGPNNKLCPVGGLTAHGLQKTLMDVPFTLSDIRPYAK